MKLLQSDVVRVRQLRWRIAGIRAYPSCEVLALHGLDADNAGIDRTILTPFDRVERIERGTHVRRVSRRQWRRACRACLAGDVRANGLRCARRASIDLLPFQLEPALAVVRGLGTRVLLADDVGLGKTVEAGLIIAELLARDATTRVLIVTPPGLRDQWRHELADRLHLDASVMDVRMLTVRMAALPQGVNPWATVPVAITSIDFLKRVEVLAAAGACRWDVIVVDEAHGVTADSDRHRAVATLAARTPHVILLTATPHNGDRRLFESLCSLGGAPGEQLLVFRRTRKDISTGTSRRIHRLAVRVSEEESRMHALLARFMRAIRREHAGGSRTSGTADRAALSLALSVLQKRALSSARSLQLSVERRLAALDDDTRGAEQMELPLGDAHGELVTADQQPEWPRLLGLRDAVHERAMLTALHGVCRAASRRESKVTALGRLLRRVREPAIVFTEYRDTLLHIRAALEAHGLHSAVLHGGLRGEERRVAVEAFSAGTVRLLLATDAAGEGLNLHHACRLVVNLELPWNPMRLEQRIGRVDRIGQRAVVHAFHLIAAGTAEAAILRRLQARVASAHVDIAMPDPLGDEPSVASPQWFTGTTHGVSARGQRHERRALLLLHPSMSSEAAAESARIDFARRVVRAGDERALSELQIGGPAGMVTTHRNTRAALGGAIVMLWQAAVEDGCGRLVATASLAVSLKVSPAARRTVASMRGLVDDASAAATRTVDAALEPWRDEVRASHASFLAAQRLRDERLAAMRLEASASGGHTTLRQRGLFDLRAERDYATDVADRLAAARDVAGRQRFLERSSMLSFAPPQLVLALFS